jgi:hypothetical protein
MDHLTMKAGDRAVFAHQQVALDYWTRAQQDDLQLIDG